ncbi:MAG: DNA-3-methyladenine glycosylase I [Candidatus Lokiarchaeota archaeon]|nr:DNA-3-methyladenine glycosylase I [Candidatus Lokiarchaeota archaeon]
MVNRCSWANSNDAMKEYHDKEWCIPVHDDQLLFEFLILEGAQAGLSWSTILLKRENFRRAFDGFDYKKISKYNNQKIEELLNDKGIIRNRLKIESVISNAKALLKVQKEFGSFNTYLWNFINQKTIINTFEKLEDLPSKTEESELISKNLKKCGFKFVGPTIIYSFMQAIGMVNDHLVDCFCYNRINNKVR